MLFAEVIMCQELDLINNNEHRRLAEKILSGEMILFTGAGFSFGAKRKDTGELIPSVDELKRILSQKILKDSSCEKDDLKVICDDCQNENESQYVYIMGLCFNVSQIELFHEMYGNFEWSRIYTINVDNVLDMVFDSNMYRVMYDKDPIYYDDNERFIVKLHGDAVKNPHRITFSEKDYLLSTVRQDERFKLLRSDFMIRNFLFIGTSFDNEIDIELQVGTKGEFLTDNRMYFVNKTWDKRTANRLRRKFKNVVFISESAESFIHKISDYKNANKSDAKKMIYSKYYLNKITFKDFFSDEYYQIGIYKGKQITWEDIVNKHDIKWKLVYKNLEKIKQGSDKKIIIIYGKPLSGKTVLLYRYAVDMLDEANVFEYIGNNFIKSLKIFIHDRKQHLDDEVKNIIIIDDASFLLGNLSDLLNILEEDSGIQIVMTSRKSEYERKQHIFTNELKEKVSMVEVGTCYLDTVDVELYLDKLNEKAFLGDYARKYKNAKTALIDEIYQEHHLNKRDGILELFYKDDYEEARRRLNKIGDLYLGNYHYNVRRFVVYLYVFDVLGDAQAKLSVFLDMYPFDSDETLRKFLVDIESLLMINLDSTHYKRIRYEKINVQARYPKLLKMIINKIEDRELLDIYVDLLQMLSVLNPTELKCCVGNINHMIYVAMRSQNVVKVFWEKGGWKSIKSVYSRVQQVYRDNHLFWIHWAISEMKCKQYDNAEQHLNEAVEKRRCRTAEIEHSFAMLYFSKAIDADVSMVDKEKYYCKAKQILQRQIANKENDAFSIHSFVVKTIAYYHSINRVIPARTMRDIIKYYEIARNAYELKNSKIRRNMLNEIYKYANENNLLGKAGLSLNQEELYYLKMRNEEQYDDSLLDMII